MVRRGISLLLPLVAALAFAAPAQAIVNGQRVMDPSAYPWQVAIITGDAASSDAGWLCGGTLMSPTLVLTAAHCVIGDDGRIARPDQIRVRSGSAFWNRMTFSVATSVGLYPDLDLQATPNGLPSGDLAMIRVPPVPGRQLAVAGDDALPPPGSALTITGWGITETFAPPLAYLREARVLRDPDAVCAAAYGADFIAATMFCASDPVNHADTCGGDSGGPVVAPTVAEPDPTEPDAWRLVGVTSWGIGCGEADHPGVYTRVTEPAMAAFANDPDPVWAPLNVRAPTLAGPIAAGTTATCQPGTWTGEELTFAYEFHRINADGSTTTVSSGPQNVYTATPADTNGLLCVELVRNPGGTAWAQSQSASVTVPVTPDVPATQVPSPDTPRVPVPVAGGTSGRPAVMLDTAVPRASRARASCVRRRCTVTVRVTDPAPSSGIRRVTGTLRWKAACRRDGRRTTCARSRRIAMTKGSGTTWTLRTPRLPRGVATITIAAVDKSGRIGTARLGLRVR